jgi:hypothetical protein
VTPGEEIEHLAASAYASGIDPLRFTAAVLEVITEEILSLPCRDPRTTVLARRIIACLLEAGWQLPEQAT